MPPSIRAIYASTSGHTEYVIDRLADFLQQQSPAIVLQKQRAELAEPRDLLDADVIILASGTWNYGGIEGQLNTHMHQFLFERAKDVDLQGKRIAVVSLGDDRYYYTTRCTERFMSFLKRSHATMLLTPLIIVNEPYGQEDRIQKWGEKLVTTMRGVSLLPPSVSSPSSTTL
jgi:flavodoxin